MYVWCGVVCCWRALADAEGTSARRAAAPRGGAAHPFTQPALLSLAPHLLAVEALRDMSEGELELIPLQDYFPKK
jgi:hypothetical protein